MFSSPSHTLPAAQVYLQLLGTGGGRQRFYGHTGREPPSRSHQPVSCSQQGHARPGFRYLNPQLLTFADWPGAGGRRGNSQLSRLRLPSAGGGSCQGTCSGPAAQGVCPRQPGKWGEQRSRPAGEHWGRRGQHPWVKVIVGETTTLLGRRLLDVGSQAARCVQLWGRAVDLLLGTVWSVVCLSLLPGAHTCVLPGGLRRGPVQQPAAQGH